jgi:UDP-glucose 4-epimerase
VADSVRAIIGLVNEPAAEGEIINVGTDEEVTIEDLAHQIKAMAGSSSEIVHVPYDEAYAPGFEDMQRRVPDISKIRRVTGWQPEIALEQTLAQVIADRQQR